MTAFQSLLDGHTTYYLPEGYGAVYFTTPFAVKTKVVDGEQKFYAAQGPYPYNLWAKVCGASCPYTQSMQGWEISKLNGVAVPTFIKSFSRGGGTYFDDGVRANNFMAGNLWGQTSLTMTNMPDETFTATLINPTTSEQVTMTLPFAFGGIVAGWSRAAMINANVYSSDTKRSHELFAERQLLDALHSRAREVNKRGISSSDSDASDSERINAAITELTMSLERIRIDTLLTHATLRRDGAAALDENRLPFIPSPRERLEDVMRLSQALWNNKANDQTLSETVESHEAPKRRPTSSTSSATEASVITGDASKWTMYTSVSSSVANFFETLTAYYGSYRGTSVLRLASFLTTNNLFTQSVNNAIANRVANGLDDNLIIDVTNNGGGLVCLCYTSMSYLINAWSDFTAIVGPDTIYSEYDMRRSDVLDKLYQSGYLNRNDVFDPTTGTSLGLSYYVDPISRTVGSKTSSYTQRFQWSPCNRINAYFGTASYHFDKIIVLTDGRCGSACAYFVSQLRENNKVRVVSYGGIYGEPLATSSFAGGNVLTWDAVLALAPTLPANPFSSYIAFNLRANYATGKYPGTPRQFELLEADWYLPIWDSFFRFYNGATYNTTARFALYESILPLFNEMPSGLPRAEALPPVAPPVNPPTNPPVKAPVSTPTTPPISPTPVKAPVSIPVSSPVKAPSSPPASAPAPTNAPTTVPSKAPVSSPVAAPVRAPVSNPVSSAPTYAPETLTSPTSVPAPLQAQTPAFSSPTSIGTPLEDSPVSAGSPTSEADPDSPTSPVESSPENELSPSVAGAPDTSAPSNSSFIPISSAPSASVSMTLLLALLGITALIAA